MPGYAESALTSVTATIIPAVTPQGTLGNPLICTEDPLDGVNPTLLIGSAAAAQAALDASQITSVTAAMCVAALSQGVNRPSGVLLATFDSGSGEDVTDAIDAALAAGWDGAVIMVEDRTDAVIKAVSAWIAADSQRVSQYLAVVQSDDSDLLTSGKPAGLVDCETPSTRLLYHSSDAQPFDAAYGGLLSGYPLDTGPVAAQVRLANVADDSANLTDAQIAFIRGNDSGCYVEYSRTNDTGIVVGTKSYDGSDWSAMVSLVYTARRIRSAVASLWLSFAARAEPIKTNLTGRAAAEAAVGAELVALAQAGHYSPTEDYPEGYTISSRVSSGTIVVDVTVYLGQEAQTISVPVIGQEVAS